MNCKKCGYEMTVTKVPCAVWSIRIPFLGYYFEIWNYDNKEYYCLECENEKQRRPINDAYLQGKDDGYFEGLIKND